MMPSHGADLDGDGAVPVDVGIDMNSVTGATAIRNSTAGSASPSARTCSPRPLNSMLALVPLTARSPHGCNWLQALLHQLLLEHPIKMSPTHLLRVLLALHDVHISLEHTSKRVYGFGSDACCSLRIGQGRRSSDYYIRCSQPATGRTSAGAPARARAAPFPDCRAP